MHIWFGLFMCKCTFDFLCLGTNTKQFISKLIWIIHTHILNMTCKMHIWFGLFMHKCTLNIFNLCALMHIWFGLLIYKATFEFVWYNWKIVWYLSSSYAHLMLCLPALLHASAKRILHAKKIWFLHVFNMQKKYIHVVWEKKLASFGTMGAQLEESPSP